MELNPLALTFIPGNEIIVKVAEKNYDSLSIEANNFDVIINPPVCVRPLNANNSEIDVELENLDDDILQVLNNIKTKNLNNVVIGLLNVNSFSSKFDALKTIIPGKVDILIIVETKLDYSYPTSQFYISGYSKPFRHDRDKHGGGVLAYIREDIPCKILGNHNDLPDDIEGLFIELNFRKSKLLLLATYHPPSQADTYYFRCIGNALEKYITKYDKFLLVGDFNAEEKETIMSNF